VTYHARIGFRRCGTSLPQLSSGPLGGWNSLFKERAMPNKKPLDSLIAEHGEKMIQINVRLWTNKISPAKGEILQKHAWSSGVIRLEANKAHNIKLSKPIPFHSLMDLNAVIEKVLIQHGIMLHTSRKLRKYVSTLKT
jgi:hypothetical protein